MTEIVNSTSMTSDNLWDDLDSDEGCQICFTSPEPENLITLKCNHKFCYDCLLESYKGKMCNFSDSKVHRICPYCRSPASFLPLRDGMKPIKGIHRNITKRSNILKTKTYIPTSEQCTAVIKSGPNMGKKCVCTAKQNGLCGRHNK
jgi:hypothetical protein